jgi:hypothetical protein
VEDAFANEEEEEEKEEEKEKEVEEVEENGKAQGQVRRTRSKQGTLGFESVSPKKSAGKKKAGEDSGSGTESEAKDGDREGKEGEQPYFVKGERVKLKNPRNASIIGTTYVVDGAPPVPKKRS